MEKIKIVVRCACGVLIFGVSMAQAQPMRTPMRPVLPQSRPMRPDLMWRRERLPHAQQSQAYGQQPYGYGGSFYYYGNPNQPIPGAGLQHGFYDDPHDYDRRVYQEMEDSRCYGCDGGD